MRPLRKFIAHLAGGVGVIGIALFFLVFSCSQKTPTAPVISQAPNPTAGTVAPAPSANLPVVGDLLGKTVGKLIGWLGGVLAIPVQNTDRVSLLTIPLGSLLQPTYITASARFDSRLNATFYDFGPDGLAFLRPALLAHRAPGLNGKVLYLWYFNPATKQWEKAGSSTVILGTATFSILHFSKWAVTEDADGLGSGGQQ
ncbi:MAG TPA: hypothetical protein VFR89_08575 [candidate division Zixibacteria bacterium]|nr:hypothetical protein [candidate division Zixibacteria bacterium]